MELVPLYRQERLASDQVLVQVNPEDLKRCHQLVERSKNTVAKSITNAEEFTLATRMGRQLKSMLLEIAGARKAAKAPFRDVIEQIDSVASGLIELVETEHKQVLSVLGAYVDRLEAARAQAERKRQEQIRAEQEAYAKKIEEAQRLQAQAEEAARSAPDEAERQRALAARDIGMMTAAQQQLAAELALEVADLGQELKGSLVPGGRVDHRYKFRLVNLPMLIASGRTGLLRCELDYYACLDEVRAQLDRDPQAQPQIPGIEITQETTVSVRP